MAPHTPSAFLPAFVGDLAAAIEAVGGSPAPVDGGTGVTGPGWTVSLMASGAWRGTAALTLDPAGVLALTHLVLGADADTSDTATVDLLRELCSQAIGSLSLKEPFTSTAVSVGSITRGEASPEQKTLFSIVIGGEFLQIAATDSLEAIEHDVPAEAKPAAPARRSAAPAAMTSVPSTNLEVVLDIELPLSVRFGSTVMSIRALSALGPGSIVDMGRSPDDPVEVLICGRVIARADVVVVGGNYGVRITDLTSAAERIRALEGQW